MLHTTGETDYLILAPDSNNSGTFNWTTDMEKAEDNAEKFYQNSEGIDVSGNELFFVSKEQKDLFILDLDAMTYERHSTIYGLFDGQPDQLKRLISDEGNSLLYFCEEGGSRNGVHARDENGWFYTILESSDGIGETTGLAFSPDGRHMYVSYQHAGIIFDVYREDGLPFHGKTLNVKYHELKR